MVFLETNHGVITKEKCVSKRIVQVLAKMYLWSDGFQLSNAASWQCPSAAAILKFCPYGGILCMPILPLHPSLVMINCGILYPNPKLKSSLLFPWLEHIPKPYEGDTEQQIALKAPVIWHCRVSIR